MQYEKLGFVEAICDLAQRAGLELPGEAQGSSGPGGADLHELMARASRFFEQNLKDDSRAQAYLRSRGIEESTAAKFALGFAPDAWGALLNRFGTQDEERQRLLTGGLIIERDTRGGERQAGFYDRFRDRLMFPIRDARGRVLGFGGRIIDQGEPKYLNSPQTPLFHKGRELYGVYEARQAHADFKRLVVVEGYMDVVRLHQAGITYAVATLGTATTQEQLQKIFRMTSEVVFCFDGDRAGRQAAWRALENALAMARDGRYLKFLFLPEGHDPDTLVGEEGAAAFENRLGAALPLSEYLLEQLLLQVDVAQVDGRARLAALARPLIGRMPEGVYRELLADALAAQIRMPAAKLKELLMPEVKIEPARRAEPAWTARTAMTAGRGNLLSQAITLVLQHPSAARAVKHAATLGDVQSPGIEVLKELLDIATRAAEPTTALLLERWRDRPQFARLSELATAEPLVADSQAAAAELQMALEKLIEEWGPGRRMNELLRKAEESGLNYDEKTELSHLLRSKSRPQAAPR
jgi:DNA primase